MNCPKCGGTGFVPTNVFGVNGAIKCDFCDGTGVFITNNEEPQTGQEWLQTATTEQLAKVFGSMLFEAWKDGLAEEMHDKRFYENLVDFWLKQPHKENA